MAVAASKLSTRAERVAEAQRLRSEGWLVREIAEWLGVARATADAYLNDPDLSKQRKRHEGYAGTCVDCGAATTGCNGRALAPSRCKSCFLAYKGTDEWKSYVTRWSRERIIEAIQWWATECGEPPAMTDWDAWRASEMNDDVRAEFTRRLTNAGVVPWVSTVVSQFGSWNAAFRAAGFEPRSAHGGDGNEKRRRSRVSA